MKKVLYLIILPVIGMVCCAITACSSDDDEGSGIVVSPSSISLHYEETQQLKADGATSWLSEDEFVASVDQSGLVKGGHVGTTKIIATNGSKKSACEVTITPKYYLFDEPLLRWGLPCQAFKQLKLMKNKMFLQMRSCFIITHRERLLV